MHSSNDQSLSLPPKCFPQDFPPPPKCFLYLYNGGSPESPTDFSIHADGALSPSSANRVSISDVVDSKAKTIGLPCTKASEGSFSQTVTSTASTASPKTLSSGKNAAFFPLNQDCKPFSITSISVNELCDKETSKSDQEKAHIMGKLNSSLSKLKKEMTDLRTMDVSLLFQLISLHEAIQDFKLSVGDRFSEAGSEYSLGSASYMGSMSSLSEEDSDWMEGSGKGLEDSQVFVDSQCASSLLDQISALVKKTDADF